MPPALQPRSLERVHVFARPFFGAECVESSRDNPEDVCDAGYKDVIDGAAALRDVAGFAEQILGQSSEVEGVLLIVLLARPVQVHARKVFVDGSREEARLVEVANAGARSMAGMASNCCFVKAKVVSNVDHSLDGQ